MENTKRSSLPTTALVLGIVAICIVFVPSINKIIAFILAILAIVFGIISLKHKQKSKSITGLVLGLLTIILPILVATLLAVLGSATLNTSDDILDKYLDVEIGQFTAKKGSYSADTKLDVTVKNKGDEKSSFSVKIEAVDSEGARLKTDTVFASDLNAGQKMKLEAFKYVLLEDVDQLKNATFKVLEVSKY